MSRGEIVVRPSGVIPLNQYTVFPVVLIPIRLVTPLRPSDSPPTKRRVTALPSCPIVRTSTMTHRMTTLGCPALSYFISFVSNRVCANTDELVRVLPPLVLDASLAGLELQSAVGARLTSRLPED